MKKLFIVIVGYYGGENLVRLVNSLSKEKVSGWELNIVVVNNGENSRHSGIHDAVDAQSSQTASGQEIKMIKNKKNLGFAGGCNMGIRYALENNADSILLLNQDTIIKSDFLLPLINNSADIVSPVIKFKRGNNWIYDYGGKVDWNIGRTYHLESTNHQLPTNNRLHYVSGCCMLVKREVFEKIGLLDRRFFLYFEDADFCLRARRAGFKVAVEPKSVIYHKLIEGRQKSVFQKYHLIRSNFMFINKYLGVKRISGYLYLLLLSFKMVKDISHSGERSDSRI